MLTVNKLIAQGRGLAPALLRRAPHVELDWDTRQKSRFDATDSAGRTLGVFLPRGSVARGGDVLVADDGSLVRVQAAPQPVLVIRPCPDHGSPFDLLRAAYHLGNRHVAVALQREHLTIEPDHVLAEMLRRMHLDVEEAHVAFEPEGGAYQPAAGHGHGHDHDHEPKPDADRRDHRHEHQPDHQHEREHHHHAPPPAPGHEPDHRHDDGDDAQPVPQR